MGKRLNMLRSAIDVITEEAEKRYWFGCKGLASNLFPKLEEMVIEDENKKKKTICETTIYDFCNASDHSYQPRYSDCFGGRTWNPVVCKKYIGECCTKCGKFIERLKNV